MKISFLLPGLIKIPVGGAKIVYRYANEFAKLGHSVSIVSPKTEGYRLKYLLKAGAINFRDRWHKVDDRPYYSVIDGVDDLQIPAPDPNFIPDADIIIATGYQTASWVVSFPESKGSKYYFIQNYEDYIGSERIVKETWKLPLKKIVIAEWLKKKAEELGEKIYGVIPNAVDSKEFYLSTPVKERNMKISMLYHRDKIKGKIEGFETFNKVKERYPDLEVEIFASRKPRYSIPDWIKLEIRPTLECLRTIYNSSAIFLHPSHQEGWPLPPAEAMACGCAIVAAKNLGVREYVVHNKTGLLSPIGDVDSLVNNVIFLLENPEERYKIAKKGNNAILKYSWEENARLFEQILVESN